MSKSIKVYLLLFVIWFTLASSGVLFSWKSANAQQTASDLMEKSYDVKLLSGIRNPVSGISLSDRLEIAIQGKAARESGADRVHALVQLYDIPDEQQTEVLRQMGVELLEYIPDYTWLAAIPAENPIQVLEAPLVRWVGAWKAEDKLHPNVRKDSWNSYAIHPKEDKVMVMVLLHSDVPLSRGATLAQAHNGISMPPVVGLHGMTMWLPKADLMNLAAEEDVAWIEEGAAPLSPNNDGVRWTMQVDPLYVAPYNLDGSDVRLFVFDGASVRATHTTFDPGTGSRLTVIDGTSIHDHPTHVAGTAAGDGNNGRAKGVAPAATIFSAGYEQIGGTMLFWDNSGDIEADYALARNTYAIDLGTNSIGSNTASNGYDCEREGDYGVTSNLLDGIVRGDNALINDPVILTWANGNERTGGYPWGRCGSNYLTTAPPSCAKNPIHVGATNSDYDTMTSFSSWGPCDDGRMKPVVSAPGCELGRATGESFIYSSLASNDNAWGGSGWCGTSMATPAVAGVVTLMIEQWRALGYGGAFDRPLPALVKAMLMHTARDLGQDGPDYIYGYGEVDAKSVIDLIRNGKGLNVVNPYRWGADQVSNGATDTFVINLPAEVAELKVSLAWDDKAAAAFSAVALVNNLDLELVAPDGTTKHLPWVLNPAAPYATATKNVNTRDNQEQVLVTNPAAGTWTIRVKGTTVPYGPQTYGLVISANHPTYDQAACAEKITNGTFESNTTGWTLSGGAQRVAAPATGHGSYSLRLGGVNSADHKAYTTISIPAGVPRAELSFFWYMTTEEGDYGHPWDYFYAEVKTTADVTLATVDYRYDGWQTGQWMKAENLDLTPWAGQTVRVYFTGITSTSRITAFFVDDISLKTCPLPSKVWWIGYGISWVVNKNWSNNLAPSSCSSDVVITNPPLGGWNPTVDTNLEVHDLTIQNGGQVNMNANTLGICGDLIIENAALFNGSGGTVNFKGSSAQLAGGAGNAEFYNVSVNNINNVTSDVTTAVENLLTLNSGLLLLGNSHLTLSGAATIAGGAFSPTRMIATTGKGELRKIFDGTGSYTFPVGDVSGVVEYTPVTLDFSSGNFDTGAYAGVFVTDEKFVGNFATTDYLSRYWLVTSSGISEFSCTTTFNYLDADIVGAEANIKAARLDGGLWTLLGFVDALSNTFSGVFSSFTLFTGMPEGVTSIPLYLPVVRKGQ